MELYKKCENKTGDHMFLYMINFKAINFTVIFSTILNFYTYFKYI